MMNEKEPDLLRFLKIFYKYQKIMILFVVSVVAVTFIFSLLLPKIYQATTTLIPREEYKSFGITSNIISPTNLLISMLKTGTMADAVIEKFDLMKIYHVKSRESARKHLQANSDISLTREKVISITVEAPSPQLCADIANYYAEYLETLNQTVNISSAKRNRLFIEQRLNETKASLIKLEDRLQDFQTKHRAVSLSQQEKANIKAAAELEAKLTADDIQLQIMKNDPSPNNPEILKQEIEIKDTAQHLKQMLHNSNQTLKDSKNRSKIPVSGGEELELDLAKLTGEAIVQETLYTLLTSLYEGAKFREDQNYHAVQVLEKAMVPEDPVRPNILKNVIYAALLSALFSVFLALFLQLIENYRRNEKVSA